MNRTTADLAEDGRQCGKALLEAFRRLSRDDGETIAREDLVAFERWHKMKVVARARQLRAEGATESDVAAWLASYRDEIAAQSAKAT